jgi:hypothetical protein
VPFLLPLALHAELESTETMASMMCTMELGNDEESQERVRVLPQGTLTLSLEQLLIGADSPNFNIFALQDISQVKPNHADLKYSHSMIVHILATIRCWLHQTVHT